MELNLKDISLYRTELMGLAILLVVLHHLAIPIHWPWFEFIRSRAEYGVDIFFFVSGLGLWFSMSKNHKISHFYVKRFLRIIPLYLVITSVVSIVEGYDFSQLPTAMLSIDNWTHYWIYASTEYWFIPAILLCYLVYPIWHKLTEKANPWVVIILLFLFHTIFICLFNSRLLMVFCRYFIFLLGSVFGCLIYKKKEVKLNTSLSVGIIVLFVLGLGYSIYLFYDFPGNVTMGKIIKTQLLACETGKLWKPYFYCIIGACLLFSAFAKRYMPKEGKASRLLSFFGKMSLEIYLIHIPFVTLATYITNTYGLNKPITGGFLIILSFAISYFVSKLNGKVTRKLIHLVLS